jgi:hypothetical protein
VLVTVVELHEAADDLVEPEGSHVSVHLVLEGRQVDPVGSPALQPPPHPCQEPTLPDDVLVGPLSALGVGTDEHQIQPQLVGIIVIGTDGIPLRLRHLGPILPDDALVDDDRLNPSNMRPRPMPSSWPP